MKDLIEELKNAQKNEYILRVKEAQKVVQKDT